MPYFKSDRADIYYEDNGTGDPVIAVHGLIENTFYWSLTGIADAIASEYRFISMDMRGHGQTKITGDPPGYDVDTVGNDIMALADHLGIERFHALTHSTGGFAAVRRAMKDSSRFATLVLTDTASFTSVMKGTPEKIREFHDNFAKTFENVSWSRMISFLKKNPGPFFRGIAESDRVEEMMSTAENMIERNDPDSIAAFVRSFYTDPDPMTDGLKKIGCPALIIYGSKDDLFIESSRHMAENIPDSTLIEYPGVGHMTAIEAPESLKKDLLDFFGKYPVS